MNVTTIVLIPGLWMTALCWEHWVKHYSDKGYCVIAASWPGMEGGIEQLRRDPSSFAALRLTGVVDHYEQIIRELETSPIIIGHGVGGLVMQILLGRGWGAAGVAIASAPPKGVFRSVFRNLKLALKGSSLTPQQFHYDFANTLGDAASVAAFERYVVPAPNRILRQVALANFSPDAPSTVRFHNDSRAPLLLIAGGQDRVAPPSLGQSELRSLSRIESRNGLQRIPRANAFHACPRCFGKGPGLRARLGALPPERIKAQGSFKSDRQLVGSTLNLTKRGPVYAR
jgi:pimeloyl-ACP methyl ester carboxylesterase